MRKQGRPDIIVRFLIKTESPLLALHGQHSAMGSSDNSIPRHSSIFPCDFLLLSSIDVTGRISGQKY